MFWEVNRGGGLILPGAQGRALRAQNSYEALIWPYVPMKRAASARRRFLHRGFLPSLQRQAPVAKWLSPTSHNRRAALIEVRRPVQLRFSDLFACDRWQRAYGSIRNDMSLGVIANTSTVTIQTINGTQRIAPRIAIIEIIRVRALTRSIRTGRRW